MTSKCVIIVEGNGYVYKKINFSITLNLFSSVIIQKRCRMYNLKIIKSGDRLEIFKINITELINNKKKVVVFSSFTSVLEIMELWINIYIPTIILFIIIVIVCKLFLKL